MILFEQLAGGLIFSYAIVSGCGLFYGLEKRVIK